MDEESAEICRLRRRLAEFESRLHRLRLKAASGEFPKELSKKLAEQELALAKDIRLELEIRYRIRIETRVTAMRLGSAEAAE